MAMMAVVMAAAVRTLSKLEASALAGHAGTLVEMLENEDGCVRRACAVAFVRARK